MTLRLLNDEFREYHGTEHCWTRTLRGYYYTDGVKAIADKYRCYWLIDYVFSYQSQAPFNREEFQAWSITAHGGRGEVTVTDGNENELATMLIEFVDLPDCRIHLWYSGAEHILIIPSEY